MSSLEPSGEDTQEILLGRLALDRKFLTPEQLREALQEQAKSRAEGDAKPRSLGNILVERGLLKPDQLVLLIDEVKARPQEPAKPAPEPKKMGKYHLLRVVGRGGMGMVYEALDTALDRRVALKTMLPHPTAGPKEARLEEERFLREAKLSAALAKHPNIVSVYEAGVIEQTRYLAMEFIEGQSFSRWRKSGSMTIRRQVALLRDVAQAVHHAHKQGVIHRDLKPENILVDPQNQPHVTDFGLAKLIGQDVNLSLTAAGMVMGTPAYMSPEQAQGLKSIDGRTDVYSLGVMLYETLTGKQPFTGQTAIEILMKAARNPVERPSALVKSSGGPPVDPAVENVCLKALAKNPKDRYRTAEAFAQDLTRWISGERITVIPPTTRKVYVPPRRWPKIALTMAGILLVSAGAVGAWLFFRPAPIPALARAHQLFKEGNYAEAQKSFQEVLESYPENQEAQSGKLAAGKLAAALKPELDQAGRKPPPERKVPDSKEDVAPPATKTSSEPPPPSDWSRAMELLSLVDPNRDNVSGTWSRKDGRLVSDRLARSRIELPFRPPEEYDLRAVFTRLAGAGPIGLLMSRSGRSFSFIMGAGPGGTVFGLETVRGQSAANNPTTAKETEGLAADTGHTAIVQVRRDGVRAYVDGRLLSQWKSEGSDLGLPLPHRLRDPALLGLLTSGTSVAFERVDLLQVTGKGEAVTLTTTPFLKAASIEPEKLKSGLIAEYCAGTGFDTPLLRRIDPSINFHWGDGAPWPGGPCDWFSCRWTGYLKVPKAGQYTFTMTSDDGARVVLDDAPVLVNWVPHLETSNTATVVLERGFHKISVEYFEEWLSATAVLSWNDPVTGKPVPVGPEALFHRPSDFRPFVLAPSPGLLSALGPQPHVIESVAFLPDGSGVVSGSQDRTVRIWNLASGKEIRQIRGNPGAVLSVAPSPDGKLAAAAAHGGKIKIWDLAGGKPIATLAGHSEVAASVAWSPDGKMLASGGNDKLVKIWEPASDKEPRVFQGHAGNVTCVAWSPDQKMLASSGADQAIRLWDLQTGKEIRTLLGHGAAVLSVTFSPDGRYVASGGSDKTVRLWSTETGKEVRAFTGHTDIVRGVSFRKDGAMIASCSRDTTVRLWDVGTGQELKVLNGHLGGLVTVAFSRDGKKLASSGYDATIRIWEVK